VDLVPNIASGDLGLSSLAEVVAAGFRAHATGTIAVEQGKGESRLFMRYGAPCGVQLFQNHKPFSFFLVENGFLEPADSERYLAESLKRGLRLGEVLVANGVFTAEQLQEFLTTHNREALEGLCLLREGKYELRGWERPPEWTEAITLDPLRAIVAAMGADELFDRRREILDQLADAPLRLADDFEDQVSRLALTQEEYDAFTQLHVPRSFAEFAEALPAGDTEAFIVTAALMGLIDTAAPASMATGGLLTEAAADEVDVAQFLTPIEPAQSSTEDSPLEESIVVEDAFTLLTPADESPVDEDTSPAEDNWNEEMSLQLDAALGVTSTEYAEPEAGDGGFGPHDLVRGPRSLPPQGAVQSPSHGTPPLRHTGGELEFEVSTDDEPLELDLQRAPPALRDAMEQRYAPPPRTKSSGSTAAVRPGVQTPSRAVSTIPPKAPAPAQEYNPFSAHFRKAVALAPSSLEELDDRLERALRGETPGRAPAVPREAAAPRTTAVPPSAPAARPASSSASSILSDIEDLVGDVLQESTGPLTLEQPRSAPVVDDDDELALLAAEEAARASTSLDLDGSSTVYDEPLVDDPPPEEPQASEEDVVVEDDLRMEPTPAQGSGGFSILSPPEPSGQEIRLTPVPEEAPPAPPPVLEKTPTPEPSSDRAGDARRRLLQRAFRNVAGTVMTREPSARHNVREADPVAARPANADATLEKDLASRLLDITKQDHFTRLGVERKAETDAIKEAFLNLAKRYHPDRLSALGQNHLLPQARELFSRIKESYDVLVDPASRARYITELNSSKDGPKTKLTPEEAKAAFQRGAIYLRKRDFKNAEAELIRAVDGDPQGEYLAELAWTLMSNPATKDSAKGEVRELIARALKSGTETDRTFVVAAHLARAENESEKAERYFRKAIEKNPKNIEAARELRLIEMRRGTEKKSGSFFDKLRVKSSGSK
jgi:curved DNA-binding protein CbpA